MTKSEIVAEMDSIVRKLNRYLEPTDLTIFNLPKSLEEMLDVVCQTVQQMANDCHFEVSTMEQAKAQLTVLEQWQSGFYWPLPSDPERCDKLMAMCQDFWTKLLTANS